MRSCQIYAAAFLALYINLVVASNIPELNQSQASEALGHFIWSELKSDTSTPLLLEAVIEGSGRQKLAYHALFPMINFNNVS